MRTNAIHRTALSWAVLVALTGVASAQPVTPEPPADPPAEKRAESAISAPAEGADPTLADRLGWNSRERTAAGIRALEKGDAAKAKEALDTALRLRPSDPTVKFNAGTGRLAAGDPSAAALLDLAAREAPRELAPAAWYNLGEARLGGKDYRGAADAFVETLKRQPDHANAKHNLELALRAIEKQRQQQQEQQKQNQQQEQQEQKRQPRDQDEKNQDESAQTPENGPAQKDQKPQGDPGKGDDPKQPDPKGEQPQPSAGDPNAPQQQQKPGSLPQFHDLPDMSADQAAAILRAVENLERQQRQDRAAKNAQAASTSVEIDW